MIKSTFLRTNQKLNHWLTKYARQPRTWRNHQPVGHRIARTHCTNQQRPIRPQQRRVGLCWCREDHQIVESHRSMRCHRIQINDQALKKMDSDALNFLSQYCVYSLTQIYSWHWFHFFKFDLLHFDTRKFQ